MTAQFTYIGNNLAPGRKIWAEESNEPWNYLSGFTQFGYYDGIGRQYASDPSVVGSQGGYAIRASHHHDVARTALNALATPRGGDLRTLFNFQLGGNASAVPIINYCLANGKQLDAIAHAPYLNNAPGNEPSFVPLYATMTAGQILDCQEAVIANRIFYYPTILDAATYLHANFPLAKVMAYEHGNSGANLDSGSYGPPNGDSGSDTVAAAPAASRLHFHPAWPQRDDGDVVLFRAGRHVGCSQRLYAQPDHQQSGRASLSSTRRGASTKPGICSLARAMARMASTTSSHRSPEVRRASLT